MSFLKAFKNAARGIVYCINNERNFRVHIVIAFYALIFSNFYNFSKWQYVSLVFAIGLVLSMEMMNTALEKFADLCFPQYNSTVRKIKDVAAGAVTVCAVLSAVFGITFFWDSRVFFEIFGFFSANLFIFVIFLMAILFSSIFIFISPNKVKTFIFKMLKR